MSELTIDGVRFEAAGETLSIAAPNQPQINVRLGAGEIEALSQFVHALASRKLNRRSAFRVPVWDSCGLTAHLHIGALEMAVKPVNLSLTGILIECRDSEKHLTPGDELEIVLVYEGEAYPFAATVRSRVMDGYSLCFSDTGNPSGQPLCDITHIVMSLQREWLAEHKHLMN